MSADPSIHHAHAQALIQAARNLGFHLGVDEAEIYQSAIDSLTEAMHAFDPCDEDRPPLRHSMRNAGYRPDVGDDPDRCFITRCEVQGAKTGPLQGKRIGLKDNVSLAGVPMTLGSAFMDGYVPDIDATVVTRLLDAGATIVGKLNMDDFSRAGLGMGTGLGTYGRPRNPHASEYLTGGSSSGSAVAVSTGAVDLAIGGDQGGSIRIPAAWCGVVGLKPTFGLVPHTGVVGIEPSVDYVGPMGRNVADVALMLDCIAGYDGYDPRQTHMPGVRSYAEELDTGVHGIKIGVLAEGFDDVEAEPDVEQAVRAAIEVLRSAGADVRTVSIPEHLPCGKLYGPLSFLGQAMVVSTYGGVMVQGFYDTHFAEVFGANLQTRADLLPPAVKLSLLVREQLGPRAMAYYGRIHNIRRSYRRAYDQTFESVDCLIMPTVLAKAQRHIEPRDHLDAVARTLLRPSLKILTRNTAPFNITGHPALSVPCAMSRGLPVGLMLVGPHFADGLLLRIARAFEQRTDWKRNFE